MLGHRVDQRAENRGSSSAEGDLGRESHCWLFLLEGASGNRRNGMSSNGQWSNLGQKPKLVNPNRFCYPLAIARSG
jgi:hypothetical protein